MINKKKKILIGYDGSNHAEIIPKDLQKAGMPDDAKVIVLTVAEAWELPSVVDRVSPGAGRFIHPNVGVIERHLADVSEKAQTLADAAAKQLKKIFPGWHVSGESAFGKPSVELINKADKWSPDLIVVGSHGRSAIGRFILGSVSQKVLHEAHCSVRIAKKQADNANAAVRVLVAVDGSLNSEATIREVANRHWSKATEIRLIAVNDPFTRSETGYLLWNLKKDAPEESEKSREWIEQVITAPAQILKSAGLNVSEVIRWGDAANKILGEADEWQADSIFVGARGLGRFKRFLLGSVSSTVAAKANCTVEIIRETP